MVQPFSDKIKMRALSAEFIGTALLLATVVGSGIMGDKLSGGNVALALLANSLATGAILVVLITIFGAISGAHFNPVVTLLSFMKKQNTLTECVFYWLVQICGALVGVWLAHAMFDEDIIQLSQKTRAGSGQFISEMVATFGLIATILGTLHARAEFVSVTVGLYITAAYWFTASTSFANPAVTIARVFSDSFSGISYMNAPLFIVAQVAGALIALFVFDWFTKEEKTPPILKKEK